jgi:hypothetical protein
MSYVLLALCLLTSYFAHEAVRCSFSEEFRRDLDRLRALREEARRRKGQR